MKKSAIILVIMLSFFTKSFANYEELAYVHNFKDSEGNTISLSEYKDKVILIVNVASRCGFTNQYEDLQKLSEQYKDRGLVVIGVPSNNFKQEPGSNKEIKSFCESNFGITFKITEKNDVIGNNAHPFYKWAKKNHGKAAVPKWNFYKIIINKKGKISDTFSSITNPSSNRFISHIEKEIKS